MDPLSSTRDNDQARILNTPEERSEVSIEIPLLANESTQSTQDTQSENVEELNADPRTLRNQQLRRLLPSGNSGSVWRGGIMCQGIWFAIINTALIIGIVADRNHSCATALHLKQWAVIEICLQSAMVFCNAMIQCKLPVPENLEPVEQERSLQRVASFYLITRLLNLTWVILAITGIIWTFQTGECSSKVQVLYTVCFVIAIMNLIILGLPLCLCCCSIPILFGVFLFCPSAFGAKPSRRATKKLIKSKTTAKKFKEGLIKQEDSNCAICLSDYEVGEELRFLRCGHHFHGPCIMQWLFQNKSCPFCKKDIDGDDAEPVKKKAEVTNTSIPNEEEEESSLADNRNSNRNEARLEPANPSEDHGQNTPTMASLEGV